jgi:hypothetical protein
MVEAKISKLLHRGPLECNYLAIKFHEVYEVVENISIDPLYLKLATALGRFCPKVKNLITIVTLVA